MKKEFRKTKVDCLADIVTVVDISSKLNKAQLVGLENGPSEVPVFQWDAFLAQFFKMVPRIKSYQHFHVDSTGEVSVQEHSQAPKLVHNIVQLEKTNKMWLHQCQPLLSLLQCQSPQGMRMMNQLFHHPWRREDKLLEAAAAAEETCNNSIKFWFKIKYKMNKSCLYYIYIFVCLFSSILKISNWNKKQNDQKWL